MEFLTTMDLERLTGIKAQTWRVRRMRGDSPPFTRLAQNRVAYPADAFREWIRERTFNSTSEETVRRDSGAAA